MRFCNPVILIGKWSGGNNMAAGFPVGQPIIEKNVLVMRAPIISELASDLALFCSVGTSAFP